MKMKAISLFVLLSLVGPTCMPVDQVDFAKEEEMQVADKIETTKPDFEYYDWHTSTQIKKDFLTTCIWGGLFYKFSNFQTFSGIVEAVLKASFYWIILRYFISAFFASDYDVKTYMNLSRKFLRVFNDPILNIPLESFKEFLIENYSDKENAMIFVSEKLSKIKKKICIFKEEVLIIKDRIALEIGTKPAGFIDKHIKSFIEAIDWVVADIEAKQALISAEA